jgi:hypothetical protein
MGALVVTKKLDDGFLCTSAFACAGHANKIDNNKISNKGLEYFIYKLFS